PQCGHAWCGGLGFLHCGQGTRFCAFSARWLRRSPCAARGIRFLGCPANGSLSFEWGMERAGKAGPLRTFGYDPDCMSQDDPAGRGVRRVPVATALVALRVEVAELRELGQTLVHCRLVLMRMLIEVL